MQLWGCRPQKKEYFYLGESTLGSAWTKKSSVSSAASDRRGFCYPAPSPDCLSSRFAFLASLSPFCCGFLLSWEPQDHGSAGGMCCSAQLRGADRVGGGLGFGFWALFLFCFFFFRPKRNTRASFSGSLRNSSPWPPFLDHPLSVIFFSSFTLAWVSFLLEVPREVEMSCPFL